MTTLRFQRKIVSLAQLLDCAERARDAGETIVHCHGCFDIVHPGHIRYLEFARRQGDLLIVSLTGDSEISKGQQRPYIPQELRAETLAALEFVDLVYIDPHPAADEILNDVRPDVYVKGREYDGSDDPRFLREKEVVERHGGRVIYSSGEIVFSSSTLIDRLPADDQLEARRLGEICGRHSIERDSLLRTLDRFKGLRVLIVGDIVMDRYVFCDTLEVTSESPMMSLARIDEQSYVGGAAIVARHVAALGAQPFLLSAAANDEKSAWVESTLAEEKVQTHLLRCRPSLVEKTRFLVEETKLIRVESGRRAPLDSIAQRKANQILEEEGSIADAIIICDFGYGMITAGLLQGALGRLRESVPIIAADVSGPHANLLNFRNVDLLCPTERELRSNLHDYDHGLSSTAWDLLERTQSRYLVVTLAQKGLVTFDRPTDDPNHPDWSARLLSEHLPSFATQAVDRLGCGDALLAATTLALATGASLMQAAYLGNAAAALEITQLGNLPIDSASLRRWISNRSELKPTPRPRALATIG